MTRLLVVALLFLLGSCIPPQTPETPEELPQLIYQAPLPPWPSGSLPAWGLSLDLKIYVASDGSVHDAELMTRTGSREWDAQALQEVRKWRFSPAMAGGKPVPIWIRQTVRVQFEEPTFMTLAELVCPDPVLADSVYALLQAGELFESLAKRFSTADSRERGGVVGSVDLRTLPSEIRRTLAKLREGGYTKPLELGRAYVIYRRLPQPAQVD